MKIIFLEEFGKAIIPERVRPRIRQYLLKAGITDVPYKTFGALFYISILLAITLFFYYAYPILIKSFSGVILFLFSFISGLVITSAIMLLAFVII